MSMNILPQLPIGSAVPRSGNAFSRFIGRCVLWMLGWRLEGSVPNLPKMVLIGAPHTSNMDGVVAIATLVALGLKTSTMVKDTAFKGPLGVVLRTFGAIPINRRSPKGVVEQSIDAFTGREQMLLLIAAEGTRHSAPDWKKGFHRIAQGAGVPVVPGAANYARKVITFGPPLMPGPDYETDLATLLDFIATHGAPRHAHRLSRPLCEKLGRSWQPSSKD